MKGKCEACGREVKVGRRFCSWQCSGPWAQERSVRFGRGTSSDAGKPPDKVTYGAGKAPAKKGS